MHFSSACFMHVFRAVLFNVTIFCNQDCLLWLLRGEFYPQSPTTDVICNATAVMPLNQLPGQWLLMQWAGNFCTPSKWPGEPETYTGIYYLIANSKNVNLSHVHKTKLLPHKCKKLFSIWRKLNEIHLANNKYSKDNFCFNYYRHRKKKLFKEVCQLKAIYNSWGIP